MKRLLAVWMSCTLAACSAATTQQQVFLPTAPPSTAPNAAAPQLVGYWDDWQQTPWSQVPIGTTTLIVAFDFVTGHTVVPDGNSPGYVTAGAISLLHQRGIKVLISLGGGSPANAFVFDGNTNGFESSLISVLQQYGYDGVDFDDESGTPAQRTAALDTLIPATRAAFDTNGVTNGIITLAAFDTPTSFGDSDVLAAPGVANALSWVNVMSYDYTVAQSDLQLYATIYPPEKLMLGNDTAGDVPIPSSATLTTLSTWVKANAYGGIMLWTLNSTTPSQLQSITSSL